MEKLTMKSRLLGSDKTEARRKLETVISLCTSWLVTCGISATSTHSYSRGFLQSVRWELTSPPSEDRESSTALQATLVPCSVTAPYRDGSKLCYRVLIYSWMTRTETMLLKNMLKSITGHGGLALSLFLMKAQDYERLL